MTDLDLALFHAINGLAQRSSIADTTMLMFAHTSTLYVPGLLVFAYALWRDWRKALILVATLAALFILGDMLGAQLKYVFARVRPCHVVSDVHALVSCGATYSFPSNHALNMAAAATLAQVLFPFTGWFMWPIVVLAGLVRVYMGAHYVSDVVGGWVIGAALGLSAAWLLRRWFWHPRKRSVDLARL